MASTTINMARDPNTLSNYNNWKTKHTVAELAIDFKKQRLTGTVTLQLESITEKESEEIILDTSFLEVSHVYIGDFPSLSFAPENFLETYQPAAPKLFLMLYIISARSILIRNSLFLGSRDQCQWEQNK
jgi:leukotriene-A4 hydrolase